MSIATPPSENHSAAPVNRQVRSIGFPKSSQAGPTTRSAAKPSNRVGAVSSGPAPRPPAKGRFFIATIMFSIFASMSFVLWKEFIRYEAYGIMDGRVRQVAAPWSGILQEVFVEDGQSVAAGQLLARLKSADLEIQVLQLEDQITLAQAALTARQSEIESHDEELALDRLRTQAEYDQLLSQLPSEKAKLAELEAQYQALSAIKYNGVVPSVESSQSQSAYAGQQARVKSLEQSLERYRTSLDALHTPTRKPSALAVEESRLETLVAQRDRMAELQRLGEIRAPVAGRVLKASHWQGEFVDRSTALFELLEQDSLTAVVYVPQSRANRFHAKQKLHLLVPPNNRLSQFEIERLDDDTVQAPENLARFYRPSERLVAIVARPQDVGLRDTQNSTPVWMGAQVMMPHSLWNYLPSVLRPSTGIDQ